MQLIPVNSKKTAKEFLEIPVTLYQEDPNWIRPLDKDIHQVFDPKKNKAFRKGECSRWILKDNLGHSIGRVAAFVNHQYLNEQPTGGIGFFECINDQEAANFIFDHCRKWLSARGMEAMDGPINFGERDRWWGLLVEGFSPPLYLMNYHLPYYQQLFENYGFQVYFHQICFSLKVSDPLKKKFYTRHAGFSANSEYSAIHVDKKNLEKFAGDFTTIYNQAWASHGGGKIMEKKHAIALFNEMKPVLDERLVWFIYHLNEPIGCWLNLPDLNQYFRHMGGKFGLFQKLQFLWLKYRGACHKFVGIVYGVVPQYQGKGLDAYMVVEGAKMIQQLKQYEDYEMQWIGDFNPKMINIAEALGTSRSRKLSTYRYLFDRNKEFKRHPLLH
ncbi:MAG: hypothetical protein ACYCOO_04885 [Chitinophagaceae bacterium]